MVSRAAPMTPFGAQSGPEVLDCPRAANALLPSSGSVMLRGDRPLFTADTDEKLDSV